MTVNFWETPEFKEQWEEISSDDWISHKFDFVSYKINGKEIFFKRKESWPKVFENSIYIIELLPNQGIAITHKDIKERFTFTHPDNYNLLYTALAEAKRIQEMKE